MTVKITNTRSAGASNTLKGDYTVKDGDTLSELAQRFGTTVKALMTANPSIKDANVIRTGSQLVIPKAAKPVDKETTTPPKDDFEKPVTAPIAKPIEAPQATGLDAVRNGTGVLSNGAKGPAVKEMQEKLLAAGQKLPKFGADSDFGGETETALKNFQRQNDLDPSGKLDKATLVKLEAAAAQKTKYPEYDKLYKDGVLTQTLAVGYDEGGAHKGQILKIVDGLNKQGYSPIDVSNMSDADLKKNGIDPKNVDREGTYFVKKFQHGGKDVTAVTQLITPETPNAKAKFAKAMNESEVVMYTGHGRYGSGPDFDDIHSTAGNYRIGDPYEKGHVTLGENDLKKANMTKDYQLMFFDGCNTKLYMDDLRTKAKGKDTSNLDVIGANTELSWGTSADDILSVTGNLTKGASIDDIKRDLNRINTEGPNDKVKDKFLVDGFKDNAVEIHPPR